MKQKSIISMFLYIVVTSLSMYASSMHASQCIIVMGASCSGKSTLCLQMLKKLPSSWCLLGLDEIEDNFKASERDHTISDIIYELVHQANALLEEGKNVLIDTNVYDCLFKEIQSSGRICVLVYCPLSVLLQRNEQRDKKLGRTARRAFYARQYVEETFYEFESNQAYDLKVETGISADEVLALINLFPVAI